MKGFWEEDDCCCLHTEYSYCRGSEWSQKIKKRKSLEYWRGVYSKKDTIKLKFPQTENPNYKKKMQARGVPGKFLTGNQVYKVN